MVRLAVTAWLVGATLFGPWLCCCTAAAAAPARVATPAAAAPHAACCGHKKAADPKADDDSRPDHPHRDCPCKAGVAKAAVVPPPVAETELFAPAGDVLSLSDRFDSASGSPIVRPDRGEGPSLSADVLLHVFHNLRC